MAVKAVAMIADFGYDSSPANLRLYITIRTAENDSVVSLEMEGLDPAATDVTLDNQIKDFVKTYCEEEWDMEFGLFDTVRVLFKLNSLV